MDVINRNSLIHNQFQNSHVLIIFCSTCSNVLSKRGLFCSEVYRYLPQNYLYSTDLPIISSINLLSEKISASLCSCIFCNFACNICGACIGLQVDKPCTNCILFTYKFGHYFFFDFSAIYTQIRSEEKDVFWRNICNLSEDI